MNCNVYVYEDFEKGYTQYPDNYTQNIIKEVVAKSKNRGISQVAICRNSNLVYLIYNYRYDRVHSFGFCLEFNNTCPNNISYIFEFFDSIIADILNKGRLLHYTTTGDIQTEANHLYESSALIDHYSVFIHRYLDETQAQFQKLPPINYGVNFDRTVFYGLQDTSWSITDAISGYGTIIITKDKEDEGIFSYKNVLKKLNEEKNAQIKENQELKIKNADLIKQKNRIIYVVILSCVVLGCCVGIYFLKAHLNKTQDQLTDAYYDIERTTGLLEAAKDTISRRDSTILVREETITNQRYKINTLYDSILFQKQTIDTLNETIIKQYNEQTVLYDTINYYKEKYENAYALQTSVRDEFETFKTTLYGYQPFLVTNTDFSFSTGDYNIEYYGLTSGRYDFKFRVIFPDGSVKLYDRSFYVYKGLHQTTVNISSGFNSSKYYVIEIMYNKHVIGGSRH